MVEIDDRTSAAAPLVLHHNVEERSYVTRRGRHVGILLGSTYLGLCNINFPNHRTKPYDIIIIIIRSTDSEGFYSVPWNGIANLDSHSRKAIPFHLENPHWSQYGYSDRCSIASIAFAPITDRLENER